MLGAEGSSGSLSKGPGGSLSNGPAGSSSGVGGGGSSSQVYASKVVDRLLSYFRKQKLDAYLKVCGSRV